ncbi:hypothetical protein [Lysobacter gummosus]
MVGMICPKELIREQLGLPNLKEPFEITVLTQPFFGYLSRHVRSLKSQLS